MRVEPRIGHSIMNATVTVYSLNLRETLVLDRNELFIAERLESESGRKQTWLTIGDLKEPVLVPLDDLDKVMNNSSSIPLCS